MVEEMGMNLTTFFMINAKKALRERNELSIVHCQLSISSSPITSFAI